MMKMRMQHIIAMAVLSALGASATIIDQWTFTDSTTPQNSDIKSKAIDTWDPAQTGNSWAGGVLTWGYDNTTAFATSSGAYQGNTWLNAPGGTIPQLVLTIDAKDINFSENGGYGWEFTAGNGEITAGKVRSRIASFNGNVTMKMEGTGTEWSSTLLYSQADYSSITDLQLTYTWDLVNNTMSMAANGSGILTAGGTGTIAFSDTVAQDLTAVTNLKSFRTRQQGQGDSYMELDTVTIEVIPEPATFGLVALFGGGILFVRRNFKI
jgi:hypothetical protein